VFFDIFLDFFKKIFFVTLALIENFEAKRAKNGSKNQKTYFVCVLDFSFAPIKGSVFLIFYKKKKFVVPNCSLSSAEILSVE
jgi:hypothetical protein